MSLLRQGSAAPAPNPRPHHSAQAAAVSIDPIIGRSLLALAVGLLLILAGLLLDPPLALLDRLTKGRT